MRLRKVFKVVTLTLFLLCAASSPNHLYSQGELNIVRHYMAKADANGNPVERLTRPYSFSSSDIGAVSVVEVGPVHRGQVIRWKWFYLSKTGWRLYPAKGLTITIKKSYAWFSASGCIFIKNYLASKLLGKWRVEVYLDNKLIASDEFTIVPGKEAEKPALPPAIPKPKAPEITKPTTTAPKPAPVTEATKAREGACASLESYVKGIIRAIEEDIKAHERALKESEEGRGPIVEGVRIALSGKAEFRGSEWDKWTDWIWGSYRNSPLVLEAFMGCYVVHLREGRAALAAKDRAALMERIKSRFRKAVEDLKKEREQWTERLKVMEECCEVLKDPCNCFKLEVYVGSSLPKGVTEVSSPLALSPQDRVGRAFLNEIGRNRRKVRELKGGETVVVPSTGWVAVRVVKVSGGKVKVGGKLVDCCWTTHEVGGFLQVIAVWPGQSEEKVLKAYSPPEGNAFEWGRRGWMVGIALREMAAYHTYSWTPANYRVPLINLVATSGAGELAGLTLQARREGWILWVPPRGSTGPGELLLVLNGKVCRSRCVKIIVK